jgi:hypothetical protein
LFWDAVAGDYRIVTQALSGFEGAPDVLTEIRVNLIAPLLATQNQQTLVGPFPTGWRLLKENSVRLHG